MSTQAQAFANALLYDDKPGRLDRDIAEARAMETNALQHDLPREADYWRRERMQLEREKQHRDHPIKPLSEWRV